MTQRVFDTDNAEDMALLWSILPEGIERISSTTNEYNTLWCKRGIDYANIKSGIILINWHDKTEIARPIPEATEQDIGKLCYFWSADNSNDKAYGILTSIGTENGDRYYTIEDACFYEHCRRLTKQEIEELC